ncbi:beta-propeller fold lactonase family protein [Paraburkholderia fungorum]
MAWQAQGGRFIYVANRPHDTIVQFSVAGNGGQQSIVCNTGG